MPRRRLSDCPDPTSNVSCPYQREGSTVTDEDDYRTERDSLGEMQVPVDAYWGA